MIVVDLKMFFLIRQIALRSQCEKFKFISISVYPGGGVAIQFMKILQVVLLLC